MRRMRTTTTMTTMNPVMHRVEYWDHPPHYHPLLRCRIEWQRTGAERHHAFRPLRCCSVGKGNRNESDVFHCVVFFRCCDLSGYILTITQRGRKSKVKESERDERRAEERGAGGQRERSIITQFICTINQANEPTDEQANCERAREQIKNGQEEGRRGMRQLKGGLLK